MSRLACFAPELIATAAAAVAVTTAASNDGRIVAALQFVIDRPCVRPCVCLPVFFFYGFLGLWVCVCGGQGGLIRTLYDARIGPLLD